MAGKGGIKFPVIINKYLALKEVCSRKESDRLLRAGKIRINGRPAEPGQMVKAGDRVEAEVRKDFVYLAYHKPRGIITHSPQAGEKSISDILKFDRRVFPLGRLDKDSSGLIILTDDGRITDRLLEPEAGHEKEYLVSANKPVNEIFLRALAAGVKLDDGYRTKKCRVKKTGPRSFSIILTEGKKRQIRRMVEALGYRVADLVRIRIMDIALGDLRPGRYRLLAGNELRGFLSELGLRN